MQGQSSMVCAHCGAFVRYPTKGEGGTAYCSKRCRWRARPRPVPPVRRMSRGYVFVHMPDHPAANANNYVLEHRLVMERHLGRHLEPWEHIHHRDENRANNDLSNLELVTRAEHNSRHKSPPGWSFKHAACVECGTTATPYAGHGLCRNCYNRRWNATRTHPLAGTPDTNLDQSGQSSA
jgi:hypothetical protein